MTPGLFGHAYHAAVTASVGVVMFLLVMFFLESVVPFSIVDSIGIKKNAAVAIIVLSVLIGLGIILAATITQGA